MFTKGEWLYNEDGVIIAQDGKQIASIFPRDRKANTHLIIAAPDMFNLLKGLLNDPDHFSLLPPHYKQAITKALAKAGG